ncbi:YdcF family protein [Thalassococcus sp. BH17M4-6]|uniref:YdcF family protein n=1 Tax=Thalassococcus sp. BH17M4-6 TaxID=3413148 RepID=UPI003BDDC49B
MRMIWFVPLVLALPLCLPGRAPADVSAQAGTTAEVDVLPPTAIVFTGQYDRIERGLELMTDGRVERLFISGVNPKAGLYIDRFAAQFDLTPRQREWLAEGRIILSPDARSTLENALETACWLEDQPEVQAVTLITSQRHMARASLALERAIAPVRVVPVASDPADADAGRSRDPDEASELAATWAITLLPRELWSENELTYCQPH